jgi:hypothetical protein
VVVTFTLFLMVAGGRVAAPVVMLSDAEWMSQSNGELSLAVRGGVSVWPGGARGQRSSTAR